MDINHLDEAIMYLLTVIQSFMHVPGKVENNITIIDLGNFSLFDIPKNAMN